MPKMSKPTTTAVRTAMMIAMNFQDLMKDFRDSDMFKILPGAAC
jgi:hypothetical protein